MPRDFPTCSARSAPIRTMRRKSPTSRRAILCERAKHPKIVAIGEAGLDYHYDNSPRDVQEASFRRHIAAARETKLPLVIHSRDCDADMAKILVEETGKGAFPAVLHCFTGGRELAFKAIELGLYISFTGILTFKNSAALREIAKELPADRILVETDAPYLAPGCRIAENATSRLMSSKPPRFWPRRAACRRTRSRARPRRISSGCSTKCRAIWPTPHEPDFHHSRLRLVDGRAARGARLGRMRSEQSEEPPPALLAFGRPREQPGPPHARVGRLLAGSARAASGRRSRLDRRRA